MAAKLTENNVYSLELESSSLPGSYLFENDSILPMPRTFFYSKSVCMTFLHECK